MPAPKKSRLQDDEVYRAIVENTEYSDESAWASEDEECYQVILEEAKCSADKGDYPPKIAMLSREDVDAFRRAVYRMDTQKTGALVKQESRLLLDPVALFIAFAVGNAIYESMPDDEDVSTLSSKDALAGQSVYNEEDMEPNCDEGKAFEPYDFYDSDSDLPKLGQGSYVLFRGASSQKIIVDESSTLADGNCAFNAVAKGLVKLMCHGQIELIHLLYAYVNAPSLTAMQRASMAPQALVYLLEQAPLAPITSQQTHDFLESLKSFNADDQQRMLAPLLRYKAVTTIAIPTIYDAMFHLGFKERLKLTYASYLYNKSLEADAGFEGAIALIRHQYASFSEDEARFMYWWQSEGYQICQSYAELSCHSELFSQWLAWLHADGMNDMLEHVRHYIVGIPVEDSALLGNFHHVQEKLSMTPGMSEQDFLQWWENEGKIIYFNDMLTPAHNAGEQHKWGGDDEIAVLALAFHLNIGLIKDDATEATVVGVGEGTIPLSLLITQIGPDALDHLMALGLAEHLTYLDCGAGASYVRFREGTLDKLSVFSALILQDVNLGELIKQQANHGDIHGISAYHYLMLGNDASSALACNLKARGVLNDAGHFITDQVLKEDGSYAYPPDVARIQTRLKTLSMETVAYLHSVLRPICVDFTIHHDNNHWSCVLSSRTTAGANDSARAEGAKRLFRESTSGLFGFAALPSDGKGTDTSKKPRT